MKRKNPGIVLIPTLALLLLPAAGAAVFLEVGSVETSGAAPLVTKTGTLNIDNDWGEPIENLVATLQENPDGVFTIGDGVVELTRLDPGASVETTDTFSVEVDTSIDYSRNVPMEWLVDFDLGGQPRQLTLRAVLDVPEMDDE